MTDNTSLVNLALQAFGDRTTITAAQLLAGSNNQAKQANLTFANTRDSLLRMAPWDCALKTANLVYITSVPGTPENTSPATNLWQPGQPRPPWAYEYQYPVDCLRACWIIPATQTGYAGGIPITTAVTGGAPTTWSNAPIPFKVAIDTFQPASAATVLNGGTGYNVGDIISLPSGPTDEPPIGTPAKLRVTSAPAGVIATVAVVNQVIDSDPPLGGSYFTIQDPPIAQDSVTDAYGRAALGTGATFSLSQPDTSDQRVILTNQEFPTLVYVRQVTQPNVWDPLFQDAFVNALGGDICLALSGDKSLAKMCYARTNASIEEARKADGNEGLTVNNVLPDWIRGRGINTVDSQYSNPYNFDWGGTYGPAL